MNFKKMGGGGIGGQIPPRPMLPPPPQLLPVNNSQANEQWDIMGSIREVYFHWYLLDSFEDYVDENFNINRISIFMDAHCMFF